MLCLTTYQNWGISLSEEHVPQIGRANLAGSVEQVPQIGRANLAGSVNHHVALKISKNVTQNSYLVMSLQLR